MDNLILKVLLQITSTVCAQLDIIGMIFWQNAHYVNLSIILPEIVMDKVVSAMLVILGIFTPLAARQLSLAPHHYRHVHNHHLHQSVMIAQLF